MQGIIWHDNKEWFKIWKRIDLSIQDGHEELEESWPEQSEILKTCTFKGCFWQKYVTVELKKVQENYIWLHWRLMQNLKEKWLVVSKITRRVWGFFFHKLENRDFILGSKMAELNKNQNQNNQIDQKQCENIILLWK